jgi:uncharacterized membrane protein
MRVCAAARKRGVEWGDVTRRWDVIEHLLELWSGLPKGLVAFLVSALPIAELRGGLPLALSWGIAWPQAYLLCAAGNFVPVVPILFLMDPIARFLRRWAPLDRFLTSLFARTRRRSKIVERYEALGLILFVAIPLPVTGAWTGALAAFLFGVRRKYAIPAIAAGILIAGVIVSLAFRGVLHLWHL